MAQSSSRALFVIIGTMNEDTSTQPANLTYNVDLVTGAVTWSDELYTEYGYEQGEAVGTLEWWSNRVHPEDAMPLNQIMDKLFEPGATEWTTAYRFRRGDNSYVPVQDHARIIRDENGEAIRLTGSITSAEQ